MRDCNDGTRVSSQPSNVFTRDFLERLDEADEPATASEAEVAGVAGVEPVSGGFGLFLTGESSERGHEPMAVFREQWRAKVAAAVLPGTGRDPLVVLRKEREASGFAVLAGLDGGGQPDVVGHLRTFDEAWASAMHVAEALLRSPDCLALFLKAAGKVALERTGTLLDRQVRD
ncbi:MAG TPA: hypothetical protein VEL74_23105 [Thermoanaerobaculia bacterium]|nr:hypothetical protein [Thermoanaerobaculia bacterium]